MWMCVNVYGEEGWRSREAALWSTSSVIYHSSQAEEESSSCSVSQTIGSLRTPAAVLLSSEQIENRWHI